MSNRLPFRHPLFVDNFGLYITTQQMDHYLMRPEGKDNFHSGNIDFFRYLNYCRIYNYLYDVSDKHPELAQMYWDQELESLAFMYKKRGKVDSALKKLQSRNAFFADEASITDFPSGGDIDEDLS